jgi:hypothetical protein
VGAAAPDVYTLQVIQLIAAFFFKHTTPLEALLILEKLKNSLSEETKEKN